jgi:hypothetical protein
MFGQLMYVQFDKYKNLAESKIAALCDSILR